eukprot:scaffold5787_cov157-Amphora_coffeaeformis.AAC.6
MDPPKPKYRPCTINFVKNCNDSLNDTRKHTVGDTRRCTCCRNRGGVLLTLSSLTSNKTATNYLVMEVVLGERVSERTSERSTNGSERNDKECESNKDGNLSAVGGKTKNCSCYWHGFITQNS